MRDNLVVWKCSSCGYEWKGKSPQERETRPYCPQCRSWNVKVKDWLIDKEKWEIVRKIAIERAGGKCEVCGNEVASPRIHHVDYTDYYNPDKVVCLCPRCHAMFHGKIYSFGLSRFLLSLGIISIIFTYFILTGKIGQGSNLYHNVSLSLILAIIGVGLITFAIMLRKDIRKVRRSIRRVVRHRSKV